MMFIVLQNCVKYFICGKMEESKEKEKPGKLKYLFYDSFKKHYFARPVNIWRKIKGYFISC